MRHVPTPFLTIPMAAVGRPPARPQDLVLWGWLRLREGTGPTPLPARAYMARCLNVTRRTVAAALDRLCRTDPPLLVITPGRAEDGRIATCYTTADLDAAPFPPPVAPPATPASAAEPQGCAATAQVPAAAPVAAAERAQPGAQEAATEGAEKAQPPAPEPRTVGAVSAHDRKEQKANGNTDKQAEAVSLFPAGFHDGLTDEQRRLVRSAFPYGCTLNQFRRLMQEVVSAERSGHAASFIAYGLRTVANGEAPWDALARHVALLQDDVRWAASHFDPGLYDARTLRAWLAACRDDPAVRAWAQEDPGRRARCNALFRWVPGS
jgi:hypothetical protein